jgi:hypothetical protein
METVLGLIEFDIRRQPRPNGSEVAIENCIKPLYSAMAQRWGTNGNNFINSITVLHEPDGAWHQCGGGCQPWGVVDLEHLITNTGLAIKAQNPSILVGAANESDLANGNETIYWNSWMNDIASSFDYAAIDVYGNSWDPSLQLVPGAFGGTCTGYTLGGCTWSAGAYSLVQEWMGTAQAKGIPLRANESNRPVWVPINCTPQDSNAFFDNAASIILDNSMDPEWQSAFVPWAAAQGIGSVSRYAGKVWVSYDAQNYADVPYAINTLMPFVADIVAPVLPSTISSASWAASAQLTTSLQGTVYTSGTVKLSH